MMDKTYVAADYLRISSDDGYSGTNFRRPGVANLLEQARSGGVQCIIAKDFSRFGRNYIEVGDYIEQVFPFLRVRFISVNDAYDSETQGGAAGDVSVAFKHLCNAISPYWFDKHPLRVL